MQRGWMFRGALVLSAFSVVACGNGDDTGTPPASKPVDGGADATTPVDSGLPVDGGSAADAHEDASVTADAGDAGASDAGPNASDASDGGGGAASPAYALFVGTDFTNAELSVVKLNPDAVAGRLPLADQDSVPYASGGLGFVLEDDLGSVLSLSPTQPWTARATIDINDTADAAPFTSNPHAIVVTAGTKAYVARYGLNTLKVVDVVSGASTGTVDLSAFVAPDDPDGLVDVTDATYDTTSHRAYFLLQRINQFDYSGSAPDYVAACLVSHAEIVAVDATTDAVVPLTDGGANGAIELLGDNPASITADFANGRLLIPDSGCYVYPDGGADAGDAIRIGRGIESVSLATATSAWLYQTSDVQRVSGLVYVSATQAYVNQGSDWFPWNPTQTTLGSAIANFPQAPFYDGTGRIVGLAAAQPGAGSDAGVTWSVVAWQISTGTLSTIAAAPFQSVVPAVSLGGVTSAFLQ